MFVLNISRADLIRMIPTSSTIAEIGVFRGGFASHIHKAVKPEKFHLIDPWGKNESDEYVSQYNVSDDMEMLYQSVMEMFRPHIETGTVIVHRDYSTKAAKNFPNSYFDWVNIDGMHSYEAVYADLIAFSDKIKNDGFIIGHDFSNTYMGRIKKFGVVRAVREFCQKYNWNLILMTNEDAPTYLLSRTTESEKYVRLMNNIFELPSIAPIEIEESLLDHFEQIGRVYLGGKRKQIIRFGAPA